MVVKKEMLSLTIVIVILFHTVAAWDVARTPPMGFNSEFFTLELWMLLFSSLGLPLLILPPFDPSAFFSPNRSMEFCRLWSHSSDPQGHCPGHARPWPTRRGLRVREQ